MMHLKKLTILNFKNIREATIEFSPRINCLIGLNGMGKTNVLDAIYYLSFCKSHFNPADRQNICFDEEFFMLQGQYERNEKPEEIYCGIKRNQKKQFKRNKKDYQKLSEHIGLFPLVMISPSDSRLILDGSEERRKYIDGVISQYNKVYLDNLIRYNKALLQRNQILKQAPPGSYLDPTLLQIWDEQLAALGKLIHAERLSFTEKLQPVFQKYYDFISEGKERVELVYQSHLHEEDALLMLQNSFQKDRILGYTSRGAHKDDLVLTLGGNPIKRFASQGQQKTYLLALKLAQYEFIKEVNGQHPILLMDDIFDKLDSQRVEQLVKLVSDNNFGQIFITDTNRDHLDSILKKISGHYKIYTVNNGEVKNA